MLDPRIILVERILEFKRKHNLSDEKFGKITGRKRSYLWLLKRGASVRSKTFVDTIRRMDEYDRSESGRHTDAHPAA